MRNLDYRKASVEDVQSILETLRLALGETSILKRSSELWNWKHVDNPFGPSVVMVACDGPTVAGVRALMRWDLQHGNETIKCLRAVDTATHPDYRRLGVFKDLTQLALEEARSLGFRMIFNTPNEKSGPGYLQLGWKSVGWTGVQVRPLAGRSTGSGDHAPRITDMAPSWTRAAEASFGVAPETDSGRLRTIHSDEYFRWRFVTHPTASYGCFDWASDAALVGRASQRNGRSELVVSDLLGALDPVVFRHASRGVRARYMAGWFAPGTPRRAISIRGGLIPVPRLKTLQLMVRPLDDLPVDVLRLDSWDIGTSDMELL